MQHEINGRRDFLPDVIVIEIVETFATTGMLQSVDAAIAAIVEQHHGEFLAEHYGSREFGIHHHVGAVADHDDNILVGPCQLDAKATGDFIAHAGEAIFHVVGTRKGRLPELVHFAGKAACRAHANDITAQCPLHRTDNLRIRGAFEIAGISIGTGGLDPVAAALDGLLGPAFRGLPFAEIGRKLFQPHLGIGNQRQSLVLAGIEALGVEADDGFAFILKQGP